MDRPWNMEMEQGTTRPTAGTQTRNVSDNWIELFGSTLALCSEADRYKKTNTAVMVNVVVAERCDDYTAMENRVHHPRENVFIVLRRSLLSRYSPCKTPLFCTYLKHRIYVFASCLVRGETGSLKNPKYRDGVRDIAAKQDPYAQNLLWEKIFP